MNLWNEALNLATEAREEINKLGAHMTPDQKLATAQVYAALAVAEQLAGDEPAAPQTIDNGAAALSRSHHGRV